jgi:hypothetical protein
MQRSYQDFPGPFNLFDPSANRRSFGIQAEGSATPGTQTGYAPVSGLEAFHNLRWGAVDAVASPRLRFQHNPSRGL